MEHQHFIPRVYLRQFSDKVADKYFIDVKFKDTGIIKSRLSTKSVAVDKNLYTLPNISTDDRFLLEKFYADNIDAPYSKVYALLSDDSVSLIDAKTRLTIIYTLMSLYFRTPKFLNIQNNTTDRLLDTLSIYDNPDQEVQLEIGSKSYGFKISELDTVRSELRLRNKLHFLKSHLEEWTAFVNYKAKCGMTVISVPDGFDLITGDNPVIIRSVKGNPLNIFDPTNIVRVPIDRKRMFVIMPNTEGGLTDRVFRQETDKWSALALGLEIEKNCERQLFGFPTTLQLHDKNQKEYGARTEANIRESQAKKVQLVKLEEMISRASELGIFHPSVVKLVKEMSEMEEFRNDPALDRLIKQIKEAGHW